VSLVDPSPLAEVLGDDPGESATGRGWAWLRAHPLALSLLVAILLGAAAVALAGQLREPRLPALSVVDDGGSPTTEPWSAGGDERPIGPVVLSVTATIGPARAGSAISVIGIAGPGVRPGASPPAKLSGATAVTLPLRAVLDCRSLPATIPAGAYGLRVRVRSGARSRTGVVDAGAPGDRWRTMVQLICAAWSSRRDLTATALTAKVSRTRAQADLSLTLTNSGVHPVTVTAAHFDPAIELKGGLPIVVPAHATAKLAVTVVVHRCNDVGDPRTVNFPLSQYFTVTSKINLAGAAGNLPASPLPPGRTASLPAGDIGLGATGIVLDQASGYMLAYALVAACGQMNPASISIAPGTVRYDAASGRLSVPVTVLTEPRRVRSLQVRPDPGSDPEGAYLPVTTSGSRLIPDEKGQARTTLQFRSPPPGRCPKAGVVLPDVLVTMDVTGAGSESGGAARTVTYSQELDLGSDPQRPALPCDGG
jgi:hypothetical protein